MGLPGETGCPWSAAAGPTLEHMIPRDGGDELVHAIIGVRRDDPENLDDCFLSVPTPENSVSSTC